MVTLCHPLQSVKSCLTSTDSFLVIHNYWSAIRKSRVSYVAFIWKASVQWEHAIYEGYLVEKTNEHWFPLPIARSRDTDPNFFPYYLGLRRKKIYSWSIKKGLFRRDSEYIRSGDIFLKMNLSRSRAIESPSSNVSSLTWIEKGNIDPVFLPPCRTATWFAQPSAVVRGFSIV